MSKGEVELQIASETSPLTTRAFAPVLDSQLLRMTGVVLRTSRHALDTVQRMSAGSKTEYSHFPGREVTVFCPVVARRMIALYFSFFVAKRRKNIMPFLFEGANI